MDTGEHTPAIFADQHEGFVDALNALLHIARGALKEAEHALRAELTPTITFLQVHLLPHALDEEIGLYAVIDDSLGCPATETMCMDHARIAELVAELAALSAGPLGHEERWRIQCVCIGLHELAIHHMTKEEKAYLPMISRLNPGARELAAQFLAHSA